VSDRHVDLKVAELLECRRRDEPRVDQPAGVRADEAYAVPERDANKVGLNRCGALASRMWTSAPINHSVFLSASEIGSLTHSLSDSIDIRRLFLESGVAADMSLEVHITTSMVYSARRTDCHICYYILFKYYLYKNKLKTY